MNTAADVPNHLGFILDGNRRWARAHGLPTLEGHRKGYDNLWPLLDAALAKGITYLSAYAFSTENWKRSQEEVRYLMNLILLIVTRDLKKLQERNMKLLWIGSKQGMGKKVQAALEKAEQATAGNTRGLLGLCINHGGRREIAEAAQRLVRDGLRPEEITEATFAEYIDHPELPPLDLVIRTSGEYRLSNFMLWRAAYAELIFVDKCWPDYTPADLDEALEEYARRHRRHGS
ncbi:MAG TPA: polyprenyl diphosphate synthase [Candidatus Saccharimonadales bacterium]|nr:polyprenyl diphosphate synthase [Candidatus Saccharimonadales bacterium]